MVNLQEFKSDSTPADRDGRECIQTKGVITRLDESMPKGVIDRTYFFDMTTFCKGNHKFKVQSVVDFEAFRSKSSPSWIVTSMKLHITKKEEQAKEARRHKTRVVQVEHVERGKEIVIKWGDGKSYPLRNLKGLLPPYPIKKGIELIYMICI